MMWLLGFFAFDKKSRDFRTFKKQVTNQAFDEITPTTKSDLIHIFDKITDGVQNRRITASSRPTALSPELIEQANELLTLPSIVSALASTRLLGLHLMRKGISLWPQGEIMMVYEAMLRLNPEMAEKAASLITYALFLMDHRFIARDTYIHLTDRRMKQLVANQLLKINPTIAKIVMEG